jgi:hypothetical protein
MMNSVLSAEDRAQLTRLEESMWIDAYSGDCDRPFRLNVTGDSAGSAL